jgi:hypothetical protein
MLNQGINTDIESIAPPRSFGPDCYDVTTARTIPDADFQAVTPDAKDKSRSVLVDAVGVTARGIRIPVRQSATAAARCPARIWAATD